MNRTSGLGSHARPADEVERWCRTFESLCRERGIRVTGQRLAVYRALAADTSHPTADKVYSRLQREMSSLSHATVYRILEFLEDEGLVRRVSTTDGVGRFDANLARHQHLVCRLCGSMRDYDEKSLSLLSLPHPTARGFVAEELDIRILGICEDCRSRSGMRGQEK
ncbi:MAG TPA: Fur family transcriptional regulator [Acidobacteriota bacterium]|nr:Fur family transcriptional regulator [Acidobacteriota bacterium]